MKSPGFIALFILCTISATAQLIRVKEINSSPNIPDAGSVAERQEWIEFKNELYFVANSDLYGDELFKTDGTVEGTKLALDVVPGESSGPIAFLTVVGDKLFFTATVGSNYHLFVTDGTQAGTKAINNALAVGPEYYGSMVGHNGFIYFTGYDAEHGYEVWKSDGTEEGTTRVKDINPGTPPSMGSYASHHFYSTDQAVYFGANDGSHGFEIWKTDGTESGTTLVKDIANSSNWGVQENLSFASIGNTIYFIANDLTHGYELWKTNGTTEGTVMVKDEASSADAALRAWDNQIFFSRGLKPYRSDGTAAGTYQLADASVIITKSVEYKGKLYFFSNGELWRTDGSIAGTEMAVAQTPDLYPMAVGVRGDKLFIISQKPFVYGQPTHMFYSYDGATADLTPSFDFSTISTVTGFSEIKKRNDKFILFINDGVHGAEPMITDGIDEPASLRNINRRRLDEYTPTSLTAAGDKAFFIINDGVHGAELWTSNATEAGTFMVKDIRPGAESSVGAFRKLFVIGNKIVFAANDGVHGTELWSSDGTETGTVMLQDFYPPGNFPAGADTQPAVMNNVMYYEGGNGSELWKTDGTVDGTVKIKDMPIYGFSYFFVMDSYFIFSDHNKDVWRSDGTADGTIKLFNLTTIGANGHFGNTRCKIGNVGYFSVHTNELGFQLWRTDGSPAGTSLIKKFSSPPGIIDSSPIVGAAGNVMLFRGFDNATGFELWRTDGTPAGTNLVKDISPGPDNTVASLMYSDNANLFFRVSTTSSSNNIWRTDGTSQGTVIVNTMHVGLSFIYSYVLFAIPFNGMLYFEGNTSQTGGELWRMDLSFTKPPQSYGEIMPGPVSSIVRSFAALPDRLLFVARDPLQSYGLWTIDPAFVPKTQQQIDFTTIGVKASNDSPFTLTATASSGLPVLFEVVSGPATISGSMLTITGAGEVTVRAMQSGDDTYHPAFAEQTFTVELFVGLEDFDNSVTISPNPATNTLLVHVSSAAFKSVLLKDMLGRDVVTQYLTDEETTIDVSHLPRGIYIVKLKAADESTATRKVILR